MPQTPEIEYFYSAHSAFAYLGAWELARIVQFRGAIVRHRPFDFAPVLRAAGGGTIGARSAAHVAYFFGRELVRWAEWRDLPMIRHRPVHHDNPLALANGLIIAAQEATPPQAGADTPADRLSRAILQAHWRDDADIADPDLLRRLAEGVGLNGAALLDAAESAAVQEFHRANTEEAIARNVFGSPSYFVGGDMFYGQDHLPMVERALVRPFAD